MFCEFDIEGLNSQKLQYRSCEASISKQFDIEETMILTFWTSISKCPDIEDLSISKNATSMSVYPDIAVLSFQIEKSWILSRYNYYYYRDIEVTMMKIHWFHYCALLSRPGLRLTTSRAQVASQVIYWASTRAAHSPVQALPLRPFLANMPAEHSAVSSEKGLACLCKTYP